MISLTFLVVCWIKIIGIIYWFPPNLWPGIGYPLLEYSDLRTSPEPQQDPLEDLEGVTRPDVAEVIPEERSLVVAPPTALSLIYCTNEDYDFAQILLIMLGVLAIHLLYSVCNAFTKRPTGASSPDGTHEDDDDVADEAVPNPSPMTDLPEANKNSDDNRIVTSNTSEVFKPLQLATSYEEPSGEDMAKPLDTNERTMVKSSQKKNLGPTKRPNLVPSAGDILSRPKIVKPKKAPRKRKNAVTLPTPQTNGKKDEVEKTESKEESTPVEVNEEDTRMPVVEKKEVDWSWSDSDTNDDDDDEPVKKILKRNPQEGNPLGWRMFLKDTTKVSNKKKRLNNTSNGSRSQYDGRRNYEDY